MIYDFKGRAYELIGANAMYTEMTCRATGAFVKVSNHYFNMMFRSA